MNNDLETLLPRPQIQSYASKDISVFVSDMLNYRKKTERHFSVMLASKSLRKVSSALVTLVVQSKRKLTLDRADEFSKLLALTMAEKIYFKNWIAQNENPDKQIEVHNNERKKNIQSASLHLLNDWLNIYVKDCFRLVAIQKNPQLIYKELGAIASKNRIDKSLNFLLKEGYLRKTLDGRIVLETLLVTAETPVPSVKIRNFHKAALSIAKQNMDMFLPHERFSNSVIMDLTPERYQQLVDMIHEFSRQLKEFSSVPNQDGDRLYQLIINLSPTGGRVI